MTRLFLKAALLGLAVFLAGLPVHAEKKNPIRDSYLKSMKADYAAEPNIGKCRPGVLKDAQKQAALNILNDIRALHGLGAVTYDASSDEQVMQASLMFAANARLSHQPDPSWTCYSAAGVQGARTSVIYGGLSSPYLSYYTPQDYIVGWVSDLSNSTVNNIGHRRWLLDPFLTHIAYGSVQGAIDKKAQSGGAAIRVIYDEQTHATATRPVIAWPDGDYPAKYFVNGALLSFSLVIDYDNRFANSAVDYSAAKVTLLRRGGDVVPVSGLSYFNDGSGLPNSLQFKAQAIDYDVYYDVSVSGVKVAGEDRDFVYWFRIVK